MRKIRGWMFGVLLPLQGFTSHGSYAVDSQTGEVVIDEQGKQGLVPASCMKLLTTGVALQLLGPETRFVTKLAYDGIIDEEGVLQGNLYVIGGGDPCLGSERLAYSMEQQLALWVSAVRVLGIQRIEGNVLADTSLWEEAMAAPTWGWEDLGNYYGAGASALSFHENMYTLYLTPGKNVGTAANLVGVDPDIPGLFLRNCLTTGESGSGDQAYIYGSEYSFSRVLRGTIPLDVKAIAIKGSVPDPALLVMQMLYARLQDTGIVIAGREMPKGEKHIFHEQVSPSLAEIVKETNQKSINLYAEHLLKKLGQERGKSGSTEEGIRVIRQFLQEQGVDCKGLQMADGSGLSRKNSLSPRFLVDFLLLMKKSPCYEVFLASLPEKGTVRAKTGSMSLVRACSGYKGDTVFSVIVNDNEKELLDNYIKSIVDSIK